MVKTLGFLLRGLKLTFLIATHNAKLLIQFLKHAAKLQVTKPAFIYENSSIVGVVANILTYTAVFSCSFEEDRRREEEGASFPSRGRQHLQKAEGSGPVLGAALPWDFPGLCHSSNRP